MGGNEIETASIDNFKSFADKGSKEMDIGWDMRLREDFPQMNNIETTLCVSENDTVERHTKSLQSCPTLCDTMDFSLPGSSVHGDSPGKNTGVACHFLLQNSKHQTDPKLFEFLPFFLPCHFFLDDFIQSYDFKCHLYADPFQIRILQSKSLLETISLYKSLDLYLTISQHLYLNMYVMGFLPLLKQNYGLSTLALL